MFQQKPPTLYERTSKLEETLEKFMQTSLTNQKNQEASLRNLETQVGQLAKQLVEQQGGQFSANTQPNLKEQCKAITIRCGKQVGCDINKETVESKQSAVTVGNLYVGKTLLDLGASISLIPLSMLKRIREVEVRPTRMMLQLTDRFIKQPYGIVEDLLVKVDKFLFLVDFVVMDIEEDVDVPLILGRPFMKTTKVIIDVDKGKLKICVVDEEVSFNVFEAMKYPNDKKDCFRLDVLDEEYRRVQKDLGNPDTLLQVITKPVEELVELGDTDALALATDLDRAEEFLQKIGTRERLVTGNSVIEGTPELKVLPPYLKYSFLGGDLKKPVILSSLLTAEEEERLMEVLKLNQGAIGWQLSDLKRISLAYCMHRIYMEPDFKPIAQPQRRLNPAMKEVVKKEVQKLLEAGMIYPISDRGLGESSANGSQEKWCDCHS